ncbi:mitochondrial import receptor subunit tom20 [Coemansia sp. RSA 922]|nr:mitochondrial import receptor subunit tom20 [Coemansia sp. S3946]KAJ2044253.1 mitochondrial import receptor subunit tom20 [Coemansia sp. S16]KAJ2113491.1 mitochondrial import receptor subunit tom20 [Coemansia sp. RSA 922]
MVTGKTIAIATAVTAAVAGLSYVAYFDYKRRNDRQFRRKLQRNRKKAEKTAQKVSSLSLDDINDQALELLNIVTKEKLPESAEDKEQFFLAQVSRGETLCSAGPAGYTEAACRFYQALMVYPNPVELVMIYQKTTPEEVFKLVMAMMAQEVRQKQSRYFDAFPTADKFVSIKDKNKLGASKGKKAEEGKEVVTPNRGLFATKSFEAGEIVYEEDAVVSTLLPCAQNGQFCYHCLKHIPETKDRVEEAQDETEPAEKVAEEPVEDAEEAKAEETEDKGDEEKLDEEKLDEEKVSEEKTEEVEAETEAVAIPAADADEEEEEEEPKTYAEAISVGLTPEFSAKSSSALACDKCHEAVYCSEKCRQDAYDGYHQFLCPSSTSSTAREFALLTQQSHELAPILIAKFFGLLVDREKKKELARALGVAGETTEADKYTTWEHLECMRYLELLPTTSDARILRKLGELMSHSVPGLVEFVTSDRYTMLKGKLDYNAYAVHTDVDVPTASESEIVSDTMRDDHGASAVGTALYLISSHIAHSCDPNAQAVFSEGTDKIAIKTLKPVDKDEELRVSFVDPSLRKEDRQKLLKASYRITCTCPKCESEVSEEKEEEVVEEPVAEEKSVEAVEEAVAEAKSEEAVEEPAVEQESEEIVGEDGEITEEEGEVSEDEASENGDDEEEEDEE